MATNSTSNLVNKPSSFNLLQKIVIILVLNAVGVMLVVFLAEVFIRITEQEGVQQAPIEAHAKLGWIPRSNAVGIHQTDEFHARYTINELGLNDDPVRSLEDVHTRILALGDSHTFAIGASVDEVWPNVLESTFRNKGRDVVVYNGGVTGYSLGQYLVRMRELADRLQPDLILIGFSMATDLYDLIPPVAGRFVYGGSQERIYYDLDEHGGLLEISPDSAEPLAGELVHKRQSINQKPNYSGWGLELRSVLSHSALYRKLKRSTLAFWIATQIKGAELWPGMDTALQVELDENAAYRWKLAERILGQLANEAAQKNRSVALINIPYLAQVYDAVWNASFASLANYDRGIGGQRLEALCERTGMTYIDITASMITAAREKKHWVHHRLDGHPTPEGHKIVANTVYEAIMKQGLITLK